MKTSEVSALGLAATAYALAMRLQLRRATCLLIASRATPGTKVPKCSPATSARPTSGRNPVSMAWGFEAALNKSQLNSCIGALDRFVAQAILRFMSTREVPKNSAVMIRISPEMRKAIDDFRGQLRPIPTAAQVVRDAIQQYLKRQQQAAKQKTG